MDRPETYDEWVSYYLHNGALLPLAQAMAKAKVIEQEQIQECLEGRR